MEISGISFIIGFIFGLIAMLIIHWGMESNGRVVMWCKEDLTDEKEKSRCWPSGDEE
ncbi:hypothetical protein LCGC14_2642610 [marine sediment metagenome]|uniref:Uncharacterized protein n=1 Tax=marine sediment metagenome TaxID=412755 RepID=A0A0F9CPB2_9ZZZZ